MKRSGIGLGLGTLVLFAAATGASGQQMTPSCQAELDKHASARLAVIEKINGFGKKRPTAQVACGTFGSLVKVEADMLKWMEDNQAWCRLPEAFVTSFKTGTAQAVKARTQVCTAAKRQAAQPRQPRGPAPGSGVQLPKGAL